MTEDDTRLMEACPHCGEAIVELPLREADTTCPTCGFPLLMPESLLTPALALRASAGASVTDAEWESLLTVADALSVDDGSECDPAYDPAPAVPIADIPI